MDRGQDAPDVVLHVHPVEGRVGAGARALPEVGAPLPCARVGETGRVPLHRREPVLLAPPAPLLLLDDPEVLGLGRPPRVVRRPQHAGGGACEQDRSGALRIRRREHDAHHPAGVDTEESGSLRPRGVHDRPDVLHLRLEGRVPPNGVGHPSPALVELDHPGKGRHVLEELGAADERPAELDVRDETGSEHKVHGPFAEDLIGDPDVPAPRIACLRRLHTRIVA